MAELSGDNIAKLYDNYNILVEAKDKITEHEDKYLEILSCVKGTANEKRLASQFIAKFFKHFPSHNEKALNAMLDLCEDTDITIRKQVIKDLPSICKENKEYVPHITDILTQLLVAEDPVELQIVNSSLVNVCKFCPKGFLEGLFFQIESGEDHTRDKLIKFLSTKAQTFPEEVWTKENEEYFLEKSRKVIQDCTKDEFVVMMKLLSSLKITKTISGQQMLVEMITEQAELGIIFDPCDPEMVDKFLMCVRTAMPHFSQFVPSNSYVQYICSQIVPSMSQVVVTMSDDFPGIELNILQILAELVKYVQPTNTNYPIIIPDCNDVVFKKLLEYLPLLPIEGEDKDKSDEEPGLQLTHVECLMYTFHTLGKSDPSYLEKASEETIKDFKVRLQYLARGVQNYIKKLKEALAAVRQKGEAMKTNDTKLKYVALQTCTNINILIRDLFHPKPLFKATINLSWKPTAKAAGLAKIPPIPATAALTTTPTTTASTENNKPPTENANKRKPITAPEDSKPRKEVKRIYAPPGGKFSSNFRGGYSDYRRGRNRGSRGRYGNRYSY